MIPNAVRFNEHLFCPVFRGLDQPTGWVCVHLGALLIGKWVQSVNFALGLNIMMNTRPWQADGWKVGEGAIYG